MAQGKFSQPRSGRSAPRRFDRSPEHKPRASREDATLIRISTDETLSPQSPTAQSDLPEDWLRQLQADVPPEEEGTPEEQPRSGEAADLSFSPDPVYNQEAPSLNPDASENPDEADEDEIPAFTDRLMAFVDDHRKAVLTGLGVTAAVLLVSIVLIIFFSIGGNSADPYGNRILSNVTVAGVNVGGMTRSEAITAVKRATANTFSKQDMVIHFSDENLSLSPQKTGASLDVSAAVDAAFAYGQPGPRQSRKRITRTPLPAATPSGCSPICVWIRTISSRSWKNMPENTPGSLPNPATPWRGRSPTSPGKALMKPLPVRPWC